MTTRVGEGDPRGSSLRRLYLTRTGAIDAQVRVLRLPLAVTLDAASTDRRDARTEDVSCPRVRRSDRVRWCRSGKTIIGFFCLLELTPKPRPMCRPLP